MIIKFIFILFSLQLYYPTNYFPNSIEIFTCTNGAFAYNLKCLSWSTYKHDTCTVSSSLQSTDIPPSEQIQVQAGDIIGLHYAGVTDTPNTGVIAYIDSRCIQAADLAYTKLHSFCSGLTLGDETFVVGVVFTCDYSIYDSFSIWRTPALSAFVI